MKEYEVELDELKKWRRERKLKLDGFPKDNIGVALVCLKSVSFAEELVKAKTLNKVQPELYVNLIER